MSEGGVGFLVHSNDGGLFRAGANDGGNDRC